MTSNASPLNIIRACHGIRNIWYAASWTERTSSRRHDVISCCSITDQYTPLACIRSRLYMSTIFSTARFILHSYTMSYGETKHCHNCRSGMKWTYVSIFAFLRADHRCIISKSMELTGFFRTWNCSSGATPARCQQTKLAWLYRSTNKQG